MKKTWSLSTTVRNPERIAPFLSVLQQMEGEDFDVEGQVKFQTLLIQNRLYRPVGLPSELSDYYETVEDKMSFAQAQEIFEFMKSKSAELSKDNGLRGRTSVAPLTKMGLAVAKKSSGAVQITSLGKAFLEKKIDIGDVYFRFFIKWQIPNPETNDFKLEDGYDIKPFVGVLHLIDAVNRKSESPKGISKKEFSIFAPTLVHYQDVEKYADKIIELRKKLKGKTKQEQKAIFDRYKEQFAREFLESSDAKEVKKLISNLKDYGDNAIRYFRLTRYIHIRGGGFYVDLEPRRSVEINNLLQSDNAKSLEFETKEDYLGFIMDISQPKLPWETKEKYIEIIENLLADLRDYESKLGVAQREEKAYQQFSEAELKDYVAELRKYRRELQEGENHQKSQDVDQIKDYINHLENIFDLDDKPIMLEKFATLALNALNDALKIQPNYPVGDDNEPTFTAPANVPDIECFYEKYNAICEVTMLTGRDQWYNEGQPVMRHLRDFENKNQGKETYCVFVAPRMHRDTINTYLMAIQHGYEGRRQKIVPLSITNLIELLKTLVELKEKQRFLEHHELFELYDNIIEKTQTVNDPNDWIKSIPNVINSWQTSLVNA